MKAEKTKIESLLSRATELGFTEQDFAILSVVAADQSGALTAETAKVCRAVGVDWSDFCEAYPEGK